MADHENDNKIQRLNYFTGQFLEANDFQAEQNYHIGMRHRGNRIRYSAGILDGGFEVTKKEDKTIEIAAGVGVDQDGKEIVLLQPITYELSGFSPNDKVLVLLRHSEKEDEFKEGAEDKENEKPFSGDTRWTESPEVIAVKTTDKYDSGIVVAGIYLERGLISYIDTSASYRQNAKALFHQQTAYFGEEGGSQLQISGQKIAALYDPRYRKATLYLQPDGGVVSIGSSDRSGPPPLRVGSEGSAHLAFDKKGIMAKASGTTAGTLLLQNEGGKTYLGGDLEIKGNIGIGTDNPRAKLHIAGTYDVKRGTEGSGMLILGNTSDPHLVLDNNEIMAKGAGGTTSSSLLLQEDGGHTNVGGDLNVDGDINLDQRLRVTAPLGNKLEINSSELKAINKNAETGTLFLQPNGGEIYIGTFFAAIKPVKVVTYGSLDVLGKLAVTEKLHISGNSDVSVKKEGGGLLILGKTTGEHLTLDQNEIMVKANATSIGTLYLQKEKGLTHIGGDLKVIGNVNCKKLTQGSDVRYKKDIEIIENALDKVIQLSGVMFHWKETKSDFNKEKEIGLIAQEVKKIFPEVVSQDEKGFLSISYSSVIPVLIEAIKEMKMELDKLTAITHKN